MEYKPGKYYKIEAYDHNLIIHADDDIEEELTIKFIGKLEAETKIYLHFKLLEYSDKSRSDLFQCVKSAIKESDLLDIK